MSKKQFLIKMWVDSSDADIEAAKVLLETRPHLNSIILFHCQQALEKILKALLIHQEIQVRKIHDLNKLLSFFENENWFNAGFYDDIQIFEKFNVEVRYPDGEVIPDHEETRHAMQIAEKLIPIFKQQLI